MLRNSTSGCALFICSSGVSRRHRRNANRRKHCNQRGEFQSQSRKDRRTDVRLAFKFAFRLVWVWIELDLAISRFGATIESNRIEFQRQNGDARSSSSSVGLIRRPNEFDFSSLGQLSFVRRDSGNLSGRFIHLASSGDSNFIISRFLRRVDTHTHTHNNKKRILRETEKSFLGSLRKDESESERATER